MGLILLYMRVHIHAMRSVHAIVDRAARGLRFMRAMRRYATCMRRLRTCVMECVAPDVHMRLHQRGAMRCNACHEVYVRCCVFHRRVTWVHILEPGTYASILAREDVQCYCFKR
jgi:hypothetical protein